MRNIGIEYSSAERSPVVLPEMAQLLPPLTGEQLAALETDLLANGCYSPIIVNEDMAIIDGHNRQELCEKHGMGVKNALESLQEHLSGVIADTKHNIQKVENIGYELRSVGGHLKNAGRAIAGKGALAVDGGQEGRFQSAVLAPMRTTQKLLSSMNNATLAAIGGVEHLEQTADTVREARAARKPSIRQDLEKKKAQVAARPTPEKAVKEKEAVL